jgi:uncharacterized protein YozE (UPF0346 family)
MSQSSKDPESFGVVDKRRFTPKGERRPEAEVQPPSPPQREPTPAPSEQLKSTPAPESEAARTARQAYERQAGPAPKQEADFETLVLSLSTSAMYQLGLVQDPAGAPIPTDLGAARHTIDILGVLQKKTRGNLTPQEEQLLEQVLYELRLAYVHISSGQPAHTRGTKRGA